jgi:hypothetical protein
LTLAKTMKIIFHTKFTELFILLICVTFSTNGQEKTERKISVLPVPSIGYSPETKTYLGAVTLFTIKNLNDSLTRTSNAKIEFNYTWNNQVIFETGWNYFFPLEKWFTRGIIHYSKYPDLYYGIGPDTPDSGEINFHSNRFVFELDVFQQIKQNIFWGFGVNYNSFYNIDYQTDIVFYPELKNENNLGLNVLLLTDSRNNILTPAHGRFFEFSNSFNFSSSFYYKTSVDYRRYFNFGNTNKHILSGRFYHESIIGNPPFYDFSMIGGDKYARGYYLGRFRDKNFSTAQMEYRSPLVWRIGLTTFGGLSVIFENAQSIGNNSFKPNAGFGLRFLVDKNEGTNLRIDYAVGAQNQSGFYISFGESF